MSVFRALAFAVFALIGASAPEVHAQSTGDPSIALVNRSGRTINAAFASLSSETNWGADRLGANVVLPNGQRFQLNLPQGPCQWDLAVVYDDGRREEKRNQNLCAVTEVTFDASQARAAQPGQQGAQQGGQQARPAPQQQTTGDPSFALVNRSGRTINEAFASLANDTNWGQDRLGANTVLPNGQRFQMNLPQGPCQWDVAVVYDDGRREEKRNQNLCAVTELAFDASQARAATPGQTQPPQGQRQGASFGTGFFVSSQGHMLTNAHVIEGCRSIVVHMEGARANANLVRKDETNDLALLRVDVRQAPAFARFRGGPAIRPGDDVVVSGFPLPQVLQNGLNITTGNVSAMAGLGGNTALMQITAPVQPGNSGGPLLDMAGNVVGVIVSKLDAQRIARVTGDIPQNVNFAVQGAVARLFVEAGGQRISEAPSTRDLRAADVGENSRGFTFQIECR
ncbi:MAG: S1C family serine protease [Tagaea sp.]